MKKYLKTQLIEVVEKTQCGGYLVQNEGKPSDRWVIDAETFEKTYAEAPDVAGLYSYDDMKDVGANLGFGLAIDAMREGYKVARAGWNGKGMFIYLVRGRLVDKDRLTNEAYTHLKDCELCGDHTGVVTINSHIDMKAADGSIVVGWLASQTDMLAEDWMIV